MYQGTKKNIYLIGTKVGKINSEVVFFCLRHMKRRRVVSIDIGRKNLAVCIYNGKTRTCSYWKNFNTNLSTYNPNKWRVQLSKILLEIPEGDIYLIEKQVPVPQNHKNLIMESIINCIIAFAFGKTPIVANPETISNYFGMTKKKYYKKKDATVICEQILRDSKAKIKMKDPQWARLFLQPKAIEKRDDLADCLLQAIWYCETKMLPFKGFDPSRYRTYKQTQALKKRKHKEEQEDDSIVSEVEEDIVQDSEVKIIELDSVSL